MKKAAGWAKAHSRQLLAVGKFLWQNRKAEIALATAVLALGREVVQIATGH